jgi:adenosylhomocysteine nucleosidase
VIGIIGAMAVEIEFIKARLSSITQEEVLGRVFYLGTLEKAKVVLVQSGIGKANAAATTALLIDKYQPTHIFNTGVAGGITLQPNDLLIATSVMYFDVFAENFGYEPGQLPGEPRLFYPSEQLRDQLVAQTSSTVHQGLLASGDTFVTTREVLTPLDEPVVAVDMESAAIAQICAQASIPFAIVRAISDNVGSEEQTKDFDNFVMEAADQAATLITNWVNAHVG